MAFKTLINDPLLNEFTYDVICQSDIKERASLTDRQLRAIKTEKTTKHFVSKSTLDEKLILLAKLGVQYSFLIHKVKTLFPVQLKKLVKKHKGELTEDTVTDVLQSGLFIVTDRNITLFSALMGNACHSENYMLNRDFYKVGQHILKWKDTPNPTTENIREGSDHLALINKLMLNVATGIKDTKGLTEIGDLDFNILMYLFNKKDTYVKKETLRQYFRSNYKMTIIAAAIKRLSVAALIQTDHVGKPTYMITSSGMDKVLKFMTKIVNDTLNY